ncbi:MAG: PIN domain-containing protein [Acidobacteria bacterium]|nr:PIN domain-containing protein [Acidobacteriota bacterium]
MSFMSGEALAFVDTNVLVYAYDVTELERRSKAQRLLTELMASNRLRLSTQVLQELYVTLTQKIRSPLSADQALPILEHFAAWPVQTTDFALIRDAVHLSKDAVLSFWDSLIVLAAVRSSAEVLYTEDLNHGQRILGVEVRNPFA